MDICGRRRGEEGEEGSVDLALETAVKGEREDDVDRIESCRVRSIERAAV